MREFRAKAIINAPAHEVYRIITDATAYPKFDPNCEKISGRIETGNRIEVFYHKPRRMQRVRIDKLMTNEIMIWQSGLPFNLLNNIRTFKIFAKDDQTTEFHLIETQTGFLHDVFAKNSPDLSAAFDQFVKGLKKFIESRP